jgi:hypothetical protein
LQQWKPGIAVAVNLRQRLSRSLVAVGMEDGLGGQFEMDRGRIRPALAAILSPMSEPAFAPVVAR